MPRLAVIDDSWRVEDPSTESYFFLAQRLFGPDGHLLLPEPVDQILQLFQGPNTYGIIDNGAYEGQTLTELQMHALIGYCVSRAQSASLIPVFVSLDYPGMAFRYTLEAYRKLRELVDSKARLLLIPHSQVGDLEGYSRACVEAARIVPPGDWLGLSILAAPLALARQGIFGVDCDSFRYGPEWQRRFVLRALAETFWETVKARGIPLHLLGLGWDWWQLADNPFLDRFQSIDTHKPATYARSWEFMEPWKVVDRRRMIPSTAIEPPVSSRAAVFKANVGVLQQLLGNR